MNENDLFDSLITRLGHQESLSKLQSYVHESLHSKDRLVALQWIKMTVAAHDFSCETRDLSIQILDKFLAHVHSDVYFTTMGSVVCLVIASKMIEYHPLSMSSFCQFSGKELLKLEIEILKVVDFAASPLTTPSRFAYLYIDQLPLQPQCVSFFRRTVTQLIGSFLELPESILSSPAVIAMSSVLLVGLHHSSDFECSKSEIMAMVKFYLSRDTAELRWADVNSCLLEFQTLARPAESVGVVVPLPAARASKKRPCESPQDSPEGVTNNFMH